MPFILKKTVKLIQDGGNDYLIAVKKNQKNLYQQLQQQFEQSLPLDVSQDLEKTRDRVYSSSLTDKEGEVLEPLLLEVLPPKKQTRPSNWTKREILDGVLYQLKNGCSWGDLPKDLPPYSTVY